MVTLIEDLSQAHIIVYSKKKSVIYRQLPGLLNQTGRITRHNVLVTRYKRVGFVLYKLFTYFGKLNVPHALLCVDDCCVVPRG